jgi:hypothetical protein
MRQGHTRKRCVSTSEEFKEGRIKRAHCERSRGRAAVSADACACLGLRGNPVRRSPPTEPLPEAPTPLEVRNVFAWTTLDPVN